MPDNTAYKDMLDLLRHHQADQLEIDRAFIEGLPPEVRAHIPKDYMTLLEGFSAMIYADAIMYCRNLVEAEKEKQEFRTSSSQMVPIITRGEDNKLRFGWTMRKE